MEPAFDLNPRGPSDIIPQRPRISVRDGGIESRLENLRIVKKITYEKIDNVTWNNKLAKD
jgi:hypothetical protein